MPTLKISLPVYKVNSWSKHEVDGSVEVFSDCDNLSDAYDRLLPQINELLELQLDVAHAEIDRLHCLNQELQKNIRQARDITPLVRPSFKRVLSLAHDACLDISKISKIDGGGWLLSMGSSLRRKFKSLRQIWDLLIVGDWILSELFDDQQLKLQHQKSRIESKSVEVRLVGHKELRSFREHHLGLPDKDDDPDALALAIYGWDYLEVPRRFVQVRSHTIVEIRRLVLRLSHLNRVQSPIINRARQDLAWQFPEAAFVRSVRSGERVPLLWGWLCGQRSSVKYDLMLEKSIGLGLTDELRRHAARICDLQKSRVTGGSDLCRKALWQWIFTRIEPRRCRLANDIGDRLGEIMDTEKLSGRPVRLVRSRVAAKAVKSLFKELVRELVHSKISNLELLE